ncbi:MAG TPA: hypothetical protein DCQ06_02195, partial [Myxococcales bacterium]|nr:hypothetical protein [Myxococcales bacterium]
MTLVSFQTGNPKLTKYSTDKLTYTFGRLAGLAGAHESYDYAKSVSATYCIPKSPGKVQDGVWGADPSAQALCDHNCCNAGQSINENRGVWSAWGSGASYRPNRTNDNEIGNINGPNPSPSSYGFRLYLAPESTLGTKAKPAASCKAILDAQASLGDGSYWLDSDGAGGNAPFAVYCDMTTDGGGWALVGVARSKFAGNKQWHNEQGFNESSALSLTDHWHFSKWRVNALSSQDQYRV